MKLWQKIFLCTLILVILAVDMTAVLLLRNTHELMVEREQSRALSEHEYLVATLKNTVTYERLRQGKVVLEDADIRGYARDVMNAQQGSGSTGATLFLEGRAVLSTSKCSSELELALVKAGEGTDKHLVEIVDGASGTYMLAFSQFELSDTTYDLVTSTDVSAIYALREEQLKYTQIISIVCALAAAGILLALVLILLRPLQRINESTRQIAQGNYGVRVMVKGRSELSELSENMNAMADAVEQNVDALEQVAEDRRIFIANLAHEMKTPLTSILGFADLLRVKRVVSDRERQEYAGIIVEETKRLRALSGKLMELITLGQTKMDFKDVPLKEAMDEMAVVLTPIMEKNELTLVHESPEVTIRADMELFKSMLYNLVDNAVKASKPGQTIEMVAGFHRERLVIAIRDYGHGIPKKEISQIVKPFYMLDKARSRKAGGAGLGLALCVEIARLHGAELKIQSAVGKGTMVQIVFRKGAAS